MEEMLSHLKTTNPTNSTGWRDQGKWPNRFSQNRSKIFQSEPATLWQREIVDLKSFFLNFALRLDQNFALCVEWHQSC